ncbi:MAG TPA: cytochrome o ubiquinol oxidase subunit IV [Candidatus Saccharimonadales bacterium]
MSEQKLMKSTTRDVNFYIIGFIISLLLIALPYVVVTEKLLSGGILIATVIGCALLQFFTQLICFLKLGRSKNGQWNMLVFLFMVMVVLIVVLGSLWIMDNLDYNMMPSEMNDHMIKESKKGF